MGFLGIYNMLEFINHAAIGYEEERMQGAYKDICLVSLAEEEKIQFSVKTYGHGMYLGGLHANGGG